MRNPLEMVGNSQSILFSLVPCGKKATTPRSAQTDREASELKLDRGGEALSVSYPLTHHEAMPQGLRTCQVFSQLPRVPTISGTMDAKPQRPKDRGPMVLSQC